MSINKDNIYNLVACILLSAGLLGCTLYCGGRALRTFDDQSDGTLNLDAVLFGPLTLLSLFLTLLSLALPILLLRSKDPSSTKPESERNTGADPHEYTP